jgi:hypothetical protein
MPATMSFGSVAGTSGILAQLDIILRRNSLGEGMDDDRGSVCSEVRFRLTGRAIRVAVALSTWVDHPKKILAIQLLVD